MADLSPGAAPAAAGANTAAVPRKRGRPPRTIDHGALVAAIERLFAAGGIDAVTIERTAAELAVSRATLYRSVPSKADLLGILFVQMTLELDQAAWTATHTEVASARLRLERLVRVQIEAAIRMRDYFFIYFDGSRLPDTVYQDWRRWAPRHEQVWIDTVAAAIEAGDLPPGEPRLTTRLILGMTIWVANWYRPKEGFTLEQIQERTLELIGFTSRNRPDTES
jgi:AcrR family transcriptional regulator